MGWDRDISLVWEVGYHGGELGKGFGAVWGFAVSVFAIGRILEMYCPFKHVAGMTSGSEKEIHDMRKREKKGPEHNRAWVEKKMRFAGEKV